MRGRKLEPAAERRDAHGLEYERVLFFSDAVFAIAITLLVIDLRLPELPHGATGDDVLAAFVEQAPRLFAYALSFATIGMYWLAHWRRFQAIARTNERLAILNLILLGLVALIPFPTGLIGEHGDTPIAVVVYAVNLSAAGLAGTATWLYAARAGLAEADLPTNYTRRAALRGLSVPIVMLGSLIVLPIVGPYGTELSWLLIFPVQLLLGRWPALPRSDSS